MRVRQGGVRSTGHNGLECDAAESALTNAPIDGQCQFPLRHSGADVREYTGGDGRQAPGRLTERGNLVAILPNACSLDDPVGWDKRDSAHGADIVDVVDFLSSASSSERLRQPEVTGHREVSGFDSNARHRPS